MKKTLHITVAVIALLAIELFGFVSTSEANGMKVFIDREELKSSLEPVIIEGRSLFPMRTIFEALGAKVDWNDTENKVTATQGSNTIELTVGSSTASANGQEIKLDVPAQIIGSSTYVPLRFISDALSYHIYWNAKANGVFISTKGEDQELKLQEQLSKPLTWIKKIGGSQGEHAYDMKQTRDGGYIIAGDIQSALNKADVYLLKLDILGNVVWEKTFGGTDNDRAHSVQQTSDGGFLIGITTSPEGITADKASLIKTDENGILQWQVALSTYTEGNARVCSARQTGDGGYIVVGSIQNPTINRKAWMVKLDANGQKLWETIIGDEVNDVSLFCIDENKTGEFFIAGAVTIWNTNGWKNNMYVAKTGSNGKKLWDQIIDAGDWEFARAVQVTSDGGCVTAGECRPNRDTWSDVLIVKIDAGGSVTWNKTFGSSGTDYSESILESGGENYVFGGTLEASGAGSKSRDYYLVKLNSNGDMVNCRTYGDGRYDRCTSVALCFDGGYVMCGTSYDADDYTNTGDIYMVKTDANGNI